MLNEIVGWGLSQEDTETLAKNIFDKYFGRTYESDAEKDRMVASVKSALNKSAIPALIPRNRDA